MAFPWQLFEAMYEAHSKRKAIEKITRLKEAMITGVWANSNYDAAKKGQESPRSRILADIDERFDKAIAMIDGKTEDEYSGFDREDPFFSAMDVPQISYGEDGPEIAAKRESTVDDFEMEFDQS